MQSLHSLAAEKFLTTKKFRKNFFFLSLKDECEIEEETEMMVYTEQD